MSMASETFKTKVRNVGTSLGLLIPKQIVSEENLKEGQDIEVSILNKNHKLIDESFGIAKGTTKFKRENIDRLDRWEKQWKKEKRKNDSR